MALAASAITDRNLVTLPLTNAEINVLLAEYVVGAVTDPVSLAFAKAVQSHIGNRHVLAREFSVQASIAHGGAGGTSPTAAQEPLNVNQAGSSDTYGTRYPA
jgi:hypothetical protein